MKLKKQLDRQQLDGSRRDVHISEIRKEADRGLSALHEAENKINLYRKEVMLILLMQIECWKIANDFVGICHARGIFLLHVRMILPTY